MDMAKGRVKVKPQYPDTMAASSAKRVRLADVAEAAGVSRTVAGHVLNGGNGNSRVGKTTAKRISEVARRMRYQPNPAARQLRGKRTQTFGLLVASAGDPLRSFLVQHLDIEAAKLGCHTIIGNTIGCEEPNHFGYYVEEFSRRGVDGVFCAVHDWFAGDREALLKVHPNTVFYESAGLPNVCGVQADRCAAARLAVRHLFQTGRRRIGIALTDTLKTTCKARVKGYRSEFESLGLEVDEALIFSGKRFGYAHAVYDDQKLTWQYPVEVVDRSIDALVRDGGADAIVAHDDFWAATLIKRLRARGLAVPQDVAIVGYLNHYLADWTDPPLTTIDLQHGKAAKAMIAMMETLVEKGSLATDERQIVVEPQLVIREST
jgi:DNA-binding LacI/PurR family transcriptional regulator